MRVLIMVFVILFMLPVVAFADVEGCGFTWVWNQMMDFGYGGIFMWIIFLTIMIVVFYLIMQSNKSKIYDNSFAESPIDILKKRYAKGEITKEEFEKMKKALKSY